MDDKRIIMDVDGVIAKKSEAPYEEKEVDEEVLRCLQGYRDRGFDIALYTARNMNTYNGRMGKINAETAPVLIRWLNEKGVPYDEIYYGKPWCGPDGFYVDDKAIRPSEFLELEHDKLREIVDDAER